MSKFMSERETTIRWDAQEKACSIWTNNPPDIAKLNGLCDEYPNVYRKVKEDKFGGHWYSVNKTLIRFTKPQNRTMTDEQKQVFAERMRKSRQDAI